MCPCTCITVALQLVSCFQIVQAFSRLVAAGDDWASATEVVLLAAVALQHGLSQADSHAMVMASSFMCSLSAKKDARDPFIACLAVHTADCMLHLQRHSNCVTLQMSHLLCGVSAAKQKTQVASSYFQDA